MFEHVRSLGRASPALGIRTWRLIVRMAEENPTDDADEAVELMWRTEPS